MAAHNSEHIIPVRTYLIIGATLLVLTAITVYTALEWHFGPWNLVIAMIIAATKGSLVALYFMHLKYDNKFYATIFTLSLAFLAIFIGLTMFDTLRRGEVNKETKNPINSEAPIYDRINSQ